MSSRNRNRREGDRSEYLGVYLLSALGLVTQVPRQEDIGFDLVCFVADQELGRLTFDHEYIVSVKSASTPEIVCTPDKIKPEDEKTAEPNTIHIDWIYRMGTPFFLAVVDKDQGGVRLFSTLPLWYIMLEGKGRACGRLILRPRLDDDHRDVGFPVCDEGDVDFFKRPTWVVDLGQPIVHLTAQSVLDRENLKKAKKNLRTAIQFSNLSRLYRQMGVPFFHWLGQTSPDALPRPAFYANSLVDREDVTAHVFKRLAPPLISLAMMYKDAKDSQGLESVKALLLRVPREDIPPQVVGHLPEIFEPSR